MYNKIVAAGHLVKDPESKKLSNGASVCSMRVCISDTNAKTKCYIDVEAWDKTGENCQKYLKKGRDIIVDGELIAQSWKNKEGNEVTKNLIRAEKVKFLNSGGGKRRETLLPLKKKSPRPRNKNRKRRAKKSSMTFHFDYAITS
jgi:single-strand DNA-binding protein